MNNMDELNNQQQMDQLQELQPDDGTPENLSDLIDPYNQKNLGLPELGVMTTPTTSNLYSQDEFREKFTSFLEFLENPATANDCAMELLINGRNLTSDKIYNMASKYSWLNWIIDRQTQVFADFIQISAFLTIESNLIVTNWTGINMLEKGKIWLNNKVKEKQAQAKQKGRRTLFGWLSSARPDQEKHIEQNN